MNVLFLTFDGLTDPLGQSQVIPYMKGLAADGHTITILSVEKKINFEKNRELISGILNAAGIKWTYLFHSRKIPLLSQRATLQKIKKLANRIRQENKIETVHCRSYLSALIGLEFKHLYKTKFIFDMRGFWADERIDGGIWKLSNPLHRAAYNYFKKKELEFFANADYVISLTENAKREFMSWRALSGKEIPVKVIPCCADLELFSSAGINEEDRHTLREQLGIAKDAFVLSYLGSLGTWYMTEEMLDFFRELLRHNNKAFFLVISPDDPELIKQQCRNKGIPAEALIVKSAGRKDVPLYLSLSDLSVYFIKPLFSKKASSPTKTGEILSMGIPVITNAGIGDSDSIIEGEQAGYLIREFDVAAYGRAIEAIPRLKKIPTASCQEVARKYFALSNGIKLYREVYNTIQNL
jgi:glycosyltransferase involved in cell wall biosynthesis